MAPGTDPVHLLPPRHVPAGALMTLGSVPLAGVVLGLAAVGLVHAASCWRLHREVHRRRDLQRRIDEVSDNLPAVVFQARRERDGRLQLELLAGDSPQLFSASPRELKAEPSRIVAAMQAQHRRRVLAALVRAVRGVTPISLRFTTRGVRGLRQVAMQAWPRVGANGVQHWTGYWMDISDQHARGEAIAQAYAQAETDAEARGRLLATLGNGIGGPMRGLLQCLSALRGGPLDTHQRAALESLEDASAMLARILDDILALSTTDDADMALETAPVALRGLLASVEQLLLPVARAKGLRLRHQVDARVARALQADGTRLRQILFNLVGNAIKFTEHGEVVIDVRVLDEAPRTQRLRIEVSDTGVGIPAARQQAVFEPFTQADASTTRRYGGTGLGLGICQRLVRRMGGTLALHSTPGQGTRVSIELVLAHCQAPLPVAARAAGGTGIDRGSAAPRVLVAEDHPTQQLLMQWWLRGMGLEVDVAGDGLQALAAWRDGDPVLLFTDDRMPGLNGAELVEHIRHHARCSGRPVPPIIGMSAEATGLRTARLAYVLTKPISRRALHEAIVQVLPGLLVDGDEATPAGTVEDDDVPGLPALVARFGSEAIARALAGSLRSSLENDLQALQQEWERGEADAAALRLHRMAGGAGSLGLGALALHLRGLSESPVPLDVAGRHALRARLQRCVQHLRRLEPPP